jgi:hypothetical protein
MRASRRPSGTRTRRFGLGWVPRADGQGFEIKGLSHKIMDVFSSRRDDVEAYVQDKLVPQFVAKHGRKPSQAEMAALNRQASVDTRQAKHPGVHRLRPVLSVARSSVSL